MDYQTLKTKYTLGLDPQQEAAVQAAEGPVLLLAVPGSGKTTVLVARLGYLLLCRGVPPGRILTMTYTVAATADMRRRFTQTFGEELARGLEFRTINALSAHIIRHYERFTGGQAFTLADERSLNQLVRELWRTCANTFPTDGDIKAVRTLITYAKNMALKDGELEELKLEDVPFPDLFRRYREALRERRQMDFDDQMVYAHQILLRHPQILAYFQEKYHYLCVDEAQDTSKIQHQLISLLAGARQNLFMVGDEDQSIYGFRAAYPQALMEFEKVYPSAKVLLMETNYRSVPPIVALADRFIALNSQRHPKRMAAKREGGSPVAQITVRDRKAQYAYLAKVAKDCKTETAVLYRDNDCALPLLDLLNRRGIGYRCRSLESSFFSHPIVRDLTDIIRFAYQSTHADLFVQLYYKFGAGITKEAALAAAQESRAKGGEVLAHLLANPALSPWSRGQVKAIQTHLAHLKEETAGKAVYRAVRFMGYGDYLSQRGADQSKADILQALADQAGSPLDLLNRLAELASIAEGGTTDPESSFILSTVHSSKGLEYERVFLMDVADGILPKLTAEGDVPEEERRIFYVAMTRAKEALSLFCFEKAGLPSSFALALFPPKAAPAEGAKPHPKPSYHPPANVSPLAEGLDVGSSIVHKSFGPGVLESKNGTIATIRFTDGTVKRIDLVTALRQKLIRAE